MNNPSQNIVVVIGPSGAGKSTLVDHYLSKNSECVLVRSYTTRPKRHTTDTSHVFVTQQKFNLLQATHSFIGTTLYDNYWYGLPATPQDATRVIVLLRAPFVAEFIALYPQSHVIQVDASINTLITRLNERKATTRALRSELQSEIEYGKRIAEKRISTDKSDAAYNFVATIDKWMY